MHINVKGGNPQNIEWLTSHQSVYGYTLSQAAAEPEAPFIYFSGDFDDPKEFNHFIKDAKEKHFLLPSTTDSVLLEQLIKKITSSETQPKSFLPPELIGRYRDSIYEKIILIHELSKNPTLEVLRQIKNEVHKIAGSAGSYGYQEMTILTRQMEHQLDALIKEDPLKPEKQLKEILDQFQAALKLTFQKLLPIYLSR